MKHKLFLSVLLVVFLLSMVSVYGMSQEVTEPVKLTVWVWTGSDEVWMNAISQE